jgi:hypothetical protein
MGEGRVTLIDTFRLPSNSTTMYREAQIVHDTMRTNAVTN